MNWKHITLDKAFWFQEGPGVRKWQFRNAGVKLLNVSNIIQNGGIDLSKTDRCLDPEEANGKYQHFLVDAGDLVIASSGISIDDDGLLRTRGSVVLPEHLPLCMNTSTIRFKAIDGVSDLSFLRHWLQSTEFRKQITREVTGIAQKNFGPSHLSKILIALPPLPEQKRIAAILDKADEIRRKREKAIELTDSFLRSVFLEMFGDPITNPKAYKIKKANELANLVRGSSPRPKGDPRYYGGSIPRLMVEDLSRDGRYVYPQIDSLTPEGAAKSRPVKAGTIVMVVSGDVGRNAILQVDACIHDGFVAFNELSSLVEPTFFSFFLDAIKFTHERRKAGAIWQNLTTSQIKDIDVVLPPLDLQKSFSDIVDCTQRILSKIRHSSILASKLQLSIQESLFNPRPVVHTSLMGEAHAL
jgi:type I restriction enzyme S subunit